MKVNANGTGFNEYRIFFFTIHRLWNCERHPRFKKKITLINNEYKISENLKKKRIF